MSRTATMKTQPLVVTPNDYDPPLNVLGTKVTVLASNAATRSYEITLQQGEEGTGPPLHSHNWDESFYVLKGQVEFSYADKTVNQYPPGQAVFSARRVRFFGVPCIGCEVTWLFSSCGP